jgi:ABC-2 type transport system permease protein
MFALPVYVPRALLAEWIEAVATVNPLTPLLEAGRGLIIGRPESVALAFAIGVAVVIGLVIWAVTGLQAAQEPAGSRRGKARARRAPA